jgi:hypothetical protein
MIRTTPIGAAALVTEPAVGRSEDPNRSDPQAMRCGPPAAYHGARPPTAECVTRPSPGASGPMLATDDVGDHLDDVGQRPLQGTGEAVASGERPGGHAHQHDRRHRAIEVLGQPGQGLGVEVMRPGGGVGPAWLDPPDRDCARVTLGRS